MTDIKPATVSRTKRLIAAAAVCGGLIVVAASSAASAAPIAPVPAGETARAEQVRWVCGRYGRCWWRPNYYGAYAYYPRRPYWRHHHYHRHYW